MIFVNCPVYEMFIVYIFGHYLYKRLLYPSTSASVGRTESCSLYLMLHLDDDREYLKVLNEAQEMLRHQHSITRVTIQIEPFDEQIMNSCETCRIPEN